MATMSCLVLTQNIFFSMCSTSMGVIDQASEPGKQLQAVVKQELKSYLGQDYNDECLPLYIVVMLAQSTGQTAVAENLVAFLGDAKAVQFADWHVPSQQLLLCNSQAPYACEWQHEIGMCRQNCEEFLLPCLIVVCDEQPNRTEHSPTPVDFTNDSCSAH